MQTKTPGQARTEKARAEAARLASIRAEAKRAAYLRERGWTCIPPEQTPDTRQDFAHEGRN
jgi:hypothetical protein